MVIFFYRVCGTKIVCLLSALLNHRRHKISTVHAEFEGKKKSIDRKRLDTVILIDEAINRLFHGPSKYKYV